jgi:hypothetical protein
VTTEKLNCSTRCSLVGTRSITLRGLLVDLQTNEEGKTRYAVTKGRQVERGFVYGAVQWRRQILRTDRIPQEEGITTMNPGAGLQDRGDNDSSLCCVTNNCRSARRKSIWYKRLVQYTSRTHTQTRNQIKLH